jgi:uracil-DNA glycosylase family 4
MFGGTYGLPCGLSFFGADRVVFATDAPLARLRGKLHTFGETNTPLVITYHPAYLLRTPGDKRKAWEDLKFARATYQRIVGGGG